MRAIMKASTVYWRFAAICPLVLSGSRPTGAQRTAPHWRAADRAALARGLSRRTPGSGLQAPDAGPPDPKPQSRNVGAKHHLR
jgi:hypothetical protein